MTLSKPAGELYIKQSTDQPIDQQDRSNIPLPTSWQSTRQEEVSGNIQAYRSDWFQEIQAISAVEHTNVTIILEERGQDGWGV